MSITLVVESTKEVDVILAGLGKLPMEVVEGLVYSLRIQTMQQISQQEMVSTPVEGNDEEPAAPDEPSLLAESI